MEAVSGFEARSTTEQDCKRKNLHIPKFKHIRKISLSDIIAATIGEDARSCDTGYDHLELNGGHENISNENSKEKQDFHLNKEANYEHATMLFSGNSNNAVDFLDSNPSIHELPLMLVGKENSNDSKSNGSYGCVPESVNIHDSNTADSIFKNSTSNNSALNSQLDFSNVSFDLDTSIGFHTNYDHMSDFITSLCETKETGQQAASTLQVVPERDESTQKINDSTQDSSINLSYDSDLEDSIHFVEPDDSTKLPNIADEDENQKPMKKRRLSECGLNTWERTGHLHSSDKSEIKTELFELSQENLSTKAQKLRNGIQRARSFSGNITHRAVSRSSLLTSNGKSNFKSPTFHRTRSFSGATKHDGFSPLEGERFNASSLLGLQSENSSLSENPFFNELQTTLLTDCSSTDCPKALFSALSNGPDLDVYARERNLQSKFSTLQSKYPDEIRELSSFYRCQSAEIETERFRELHDENVPLSFRNHLNRYYDDQLHMIMGRMEKSIQLLNVAKRDIVTINRSFRPRPLLSRRAVSMMEEWYTRNFEHPYPSQTAVEALAKAGEINPEQVKKWFANKRNRCKNTLPITEVANKKRKRQFSSRW